MLTHHLPGRSQTMLHTLITLSQTLRDLGNLHTAIDMQAIDLSTVLRHTGQASLQLLRDVADAQYGTGRVIDGIGVFQIMLGLAPTAP